VHKFSFQRLSSELPLYVDSTFHNFQQSHSVRSSLDAPTMCSVYQQIEDCVVGLTGINYYFLLFLMAWVTFYQSSWSHISKTLFLKKTTRMLGPQSVQPAFYACSFCLPLSCTWATCFLLKMSKYGWTFVSSAQHSGLPLPVTCGAVHCYVLNTKG